MAAPLSVAGTGGRTPGTEAPLAPSPVAKGVEPPPGPGLMPPWSSLSPGASLPPGPFREHSEEALLTLTEV